MNTTAHVHVVLGGGPAGTTVVTQLADAGERVRLIDWYRGALVGGAS